jgi:hypothetical protein
MNLAAPGKGGVVLHKSSDDQITSESAMRWLLSRPDFRWSIWQQQKNIHLPLPFPKQATPSTVEPLFVPVAGDGSWFSPAERHQRDGHYHVGNGDDKKQFDDYWTALDFLARAASPRCYVIYDDFFSETFVLQDISPAGIDAALLRIYEAFFRAAGYQRPTNLFGFPPVQVT